MVHSKFQWQGNGIVFVRNCFAYTEQNCLLLLHFIEIIRFFWFYVRRRTIFENTRMTENDKAKKCNSLTFRLI